MQSLIARVLTSAHLTGMLNTPHPINLGFVTTTVSNVHRAVELMRIHQPSVGAAFGNDRR